MKKCLVIPGTFLPTNDTITQLVYKQLRLLPLEYDVYTLTTKKNDPSFEQLLKTDKNFQKFNIVPTLDYDDVLFSIKNINLFKGLRNMKRYIQICTAAYSGQEYLYTSSWPCYTTRVGVMLKEKHPEMIWIANFTDPIDHSPYKFDKETYQAYSLPEKLAFKLYIKYYVVDKDEANAFEKADYLLFICPEQRDFMIQQYEIYFSNVTKDEILKKSIIVPLCYIPEWNLISTLDVKKHNKKFTLAHFGRVYGLRKVTEFLFAVKKFVEEYPNVPFVITQYGEFRNDYKKTIRRLKLNDYFEFVDKIPYDQCINKMKEADAVLLFDTILPKDEIQPYLPSKLLEYSILKKNVLAISTQTSPTYRIMKSSNAIVCSYDRDDIILGLVKTIIDRVTSQVNYCNTNEEAIIEVKNKLFNEKSC